MSEPTSIDHIGLVGKNLSVLEDAFHRIGFTIAPRCELVRIADDGSATTLGQVNCHLIFPNSYVELTAVEGDLTGHHLEKALSRYFGLHLIVLTTPDAAETRRMLVEAGNTVSELGMAGRQIRYPDATGDARFRWFVVPDIDEAFLCYVEQLTPELIFNRTLSHHPNGARELDGVLICTEAPAEAAGRMARLTGANVALDTKDQARVDLPLGTIRYIAPEQIACEYPGVEPPAVPWVAGFSVACGAPDATARYLASAGIEHRKRGSGLWLDPDQCGGAIVEFVARQAQ